MLAALAAIAISSGSVHVSAAPLVATRDGQVRVEVTGAAAPVSAHLAGGLASGGRWFRWVALHPQGPGSWSALLRAPGYYGVYPLQLRVAGKVLPTEVSVRILPRGFAQRPAFATPEQVAEWWTRIAPPGAVVDSVTTWHTGFFTHRDPTLNRLLLVHFTLNGPWRPAFPKAGAATIFLSVARLTPDGPWRLLETTTRP
jgi:hypothetical protein